MKILIETYNRVYYVKLLENDIKADDGVDISMQN